MLLGPRVFRSTHNSSLFVVSFVILGPGSIVLLYLGKFIIFCAKIRGVGPPSVDKYGRGELHQQTQQRKQLILG